MQLFERYIARHLLPAILIVLFVLLAIDILFSWVQELKWVGREDYHLSTSLAFMGFTLPRRLYMLFPWAALLGSLLALGALHARSELLVLRAGGVSLAGLIYAVLKTAVILILVMTLIGEGLAPSMERLGQSIRAFALSGGQTIQTPYGVWVRQGMYFIHIKTVQNEGELYGITRYQFDEHRRLLSVSFASHATRIGKEWQLNNIETTDFLENNLKTTSVASQSFQGLPSPEILETLGSKHPERLSLITLWRSIRHSSENALSTQTYELAFWSKLMQPIMILVMVFLAIPFVFGPLRSGGAGLRMIVGSLMGFAVHLCNTFAPLTVAYHMPPVVAAALPALLFAALGLGLMRRLS